MTHTYLKLGIGPSGNLNNHVENAFLLVGIEGDIVKGGDDLAADFGSLLVNLLLDVELEFRGVEGPILANGVADFGSHFG